jgi:hypothetical protein
MPGVSADMLIVIGPRLITNLPKSPKTTLLEPAATLGSDGQTSPKRNSLPEICRRLKPAPNEKITFTAHLKVRPSKTVAP